MAFQPVPNVAEVRVRTVVDNQNLLNILHFAHETGPITGTNLAELLGIVDAWYSSAILPWLSADLTYRGVDGYDISIPNGVYWGDSTSAGPGGSGGESMPGNVAFVVKFYTAERGRSGRGRNYIPGIPEPNVTINTLDITTANNLADGYGGLVAGGTYDPSPWLWVVVSRVSGGVRRAEGVFVPIIGVEYVDLTVDSQRRRLPGRGK